MRDGPTLAWQDRVPTKEPPNWIMLRVQPSASVQQQTWLPSFVSLRLPAGEPCSYQPEHLNILRASYQCRTPNCRNKSLWPQKHCGSARAQENWWSLHLKKGQHAVLQNHPPHLKKHTFARTLAAAPAHLQINSMASWSSSFSLHSVKGLEERLRTELKGASKTQRSQRPAPTQTLTMSGGSSKDTPVRRIISSLAACKQAVQVSSQVCATLDEVQSWLLPPSLPTENAHPKSLHDPRTPL